MNPARRLAAILTDPSRTSGLSSGEWQSLLTCAHAEALLGTLAARLESAEVPTAVGRVLDNARKESAYGHVRAHWEINRAADALKRFDGQVILLKGSAYLAAGLSPLPGRQIGDLDILVAKNELSEVEKQLLDAGWDWVKSDPYDDAYYRQWMHELPPLIHADRDRMIDVHHTILPLTAKPMPDAEAMIAEAVPVENGLYVLKPEDMICHAAAHLFADGDMEGGLRNLWDIDRLLRSFAESNPGFWDALSQRAERHQLTKAVLRAVRLANRVYETPVPQERAGQKSGDVQFIARIMARDGWGRAVNKPTRFAFYVRSHWLRMPPAMLARHLFTKWRKRRVSAAD